MNLVVLFKHFIKLKNLIKNHFDKKYHFHCKNIDFKFLIEMSQHILCGAVKVRGKGTCKQKVSSKNTKCRFHNGTDKKQVVSYKKKYISYNGNNKGKKINPLIDKGSHINIIKRTGIEGNYFSFPDEAKNIVKKIVFEHLLKNVEYLNEAVIEFDMINIRNNNIHFESDEGQIGKTHLILIMSFIERFLLNRKPFIMLYNRLDQLDQLKNRFKKFNNEIESIIDLLEDHNFSEYDKNHYKDALKLKAFDIKTNQDVIELGLSHAKTGIIPIILGNKSQMQKLIKILNNCVSSAFIQIPIIDEVHSFIADLKMKKATTIEFNNILEKIKIQNGRVITVSATGFAYYNWSVISIDLPIFIKVKEISHYKNKNLSYKKYENMNKIIQNWDTKHFKNFDTLIEKEENSLKRILSEYTNDLLNNTNVRQMMLFAGLTNNDDQEKIRDYFKQYFSNLFEKNNEYFKGIITYNQSNNRCIEDILDDFVELEQDQPIIIICKSKGTQGTTFKPDNLQKAINHRQKMFGLTHAVFNLSEKDHQEHMVQYISRVCGWYPEEHKIKVFISHDDDKKYMKNIDAKNALTEKLAKDSKFLFRQKNKYNTRTSMEQISLPNITNKFTRNDADDTSFYHNDNGMFFNDYTELNNYTDNNGIIYNKLNKKDYLTILQESSKWKRFGDLLNESKVDTGYLIQKITDKNDLRDFINNLIRIKEGKVPDSIQLGYRLDRQKTLEKPLGYRPIRYQCEYISLPYNFIYPSNKIPYTKSYFKPEELINDTFYSYERTDVSGVFLFKHNSDPINREKFTYIDHK